MQVANSLLAGGWGADTAVRTLRVPESCVVTTRPPTSMASVRRAGTGHGARTTGTAQTFH
jgi:hypothetical protein